MEITEIWYKAEYYIYSFVMILMMSYVLYRFAKPFMREQKNAVFAGASYFIIMQLLDFIPIIISNFAAYGLGTLAAFLMMCLTERKNYRQKIFIATTFFSLRWLSLYMIGVCLDRMSEYITYTSYMGGNAVGRFCSMVSIDILNLALTFCVLRISIGLIIKYYTNKGEDMTTGEMLMLITPSVAGMTGYWMIKYYQSYIEVGMGVVLSGIYYGVMLLHYGISIVTIVVVTVLFQNIKAKKEEELHSKMLSEQINSMKYHIGQVENLYQDIRGIKHDMSNHILTLEKLYAENETTAAKEYVEELKASLINVDGEIKSGNPVTDVILQEWKAKAEKQNILFNCEFCFPTGSKINAFDVSILLNNALQNAIENTAGEKEPYIELVSYRNKNAFMIEIKNSFTGKLRWDTENMLPLTSKEKTVDADHGYGVYNMRKVAEKYMGDIDVSVMDGEFQLGVILMME